MPIICKMNGQEYDLYELAKVIYEAYDSGIFLSQDQQIYKEIVEIVENKLYSCNTNFHLLHRDYQLIAEYLRKIAFLYYRNSTKCATCDTYLAMLKSVTFTHKIGVREQEIINKIKNDYILANVEIKTPNDKNVHNYIMRFAGYYSQAARIAARCDQGSALDPMRS